MSVRMADDYVEIVDLKSKKPGGGDSDYASLLERLKAEPVSTVRALLSDCKKDKDSREAAWSRYRRKYRRGLQYTNSGDGQNYATNYAYNVVETAKANLLLGLPSISAVPVEEGDDTASEVFTDITRQALDRARLRERIEDMVTNGIITGFGWIKVWYDPDAFFKKGDLALTAIMPEDMFFLGTELDFSKAKVLIQRIRDVPEESIKAEYGVDEVLGEKDEERGQKKSVLRVHDVYECWIQHTDGKWWFCTVAGDTVLSAPKKYSAKHGKSPFVVWLDGMDRGAENAYHVGIGEIEEMEPLLDLAHAIDQRIYKNIKQITARQRVLNPASGISRDDVDDTPNRVYLCAGRPQDSMMWDNPPALGTDVYLYREKIEDRIQTVTGIFDVAQGQKPSGVQAARAISALQTAALKRLEKKQDTLKGVMSEIGERGCALILENYSGERIIRMEGGKVRKIVDKYPEVLSSPTAYVEPEPVDPMMGGMPPEMAGMPPEMGGMPQMTPAPQMPGMAPPSGDMMPEMPEDEPVEEDEEESDTDLLIEREQWKAENGVDLVLEDIDFNYDIIVTSDTVLPANRADRFQMAMDMFRLGMIDRKAALDMVDFPDRANILKRLAAATTGKTPPEMDQDNAAAVQQQQQFDMQQVMQQMMSQG